MIFEDLAALTAKLTSTSEPNEIFATASSVAGLITSRVLLVYGFTQAPFKKIYPPMIAFTSRNSSNPHSAFSRPFPDCLYPPKGASAPPEP